MKFSKLARVMFLLLFCLSISISLFGQESPIDEAHVHSELVTSTNTNDPGTSSVTVKFTIDLPIPGTPQNPLLPEDTTHYKIFLDYGDANYEKAIVNYPQGVAPQDHPLYHEVIRPDNIRDTFLRYEKIYTYLTKPTKPFRASFAKIKSTDHVPPPSKRVNLTGPNSENLLKAELNHLAPATAVPIRDTEKEEKAQQAIPRTATGQSPEVDNIRLQFVMPPVRSNDYIGILEISNDDVPIDSATVLLYYNLPAFAENDFDIPIDSIRSWKNEQFESIDISSIPDPIQQSTATLPQDATTSTSSNNFSHIREFKVRNLDPYELRRIIIPFQCPENMGLNLFSPVVFFGIILDSDKAQEFKERTKNMGMVNFYQLQPVEEIDTSASPLLLAHKQVIYREGEDYVLADVTIEQLRSLLSKESNNNYEVHISEEVKAVITDLAGSITDTVLTKDYVRDGYDPNSITVDPDFFTCEGDVIIGTVNFENTGTGPANEVFINIPIPDYLDSNSFKIYGKPSFESRPTDSFFSRNDTLFYQIKFDNIHLYGTEELALKKGEQVTNPNNNKISVGQNTAGAITQGFIRFKAKTKETNNNLPITKYINVEILFKANGPVTKDVDTLTYLQLDCNENISILGLYLKAGLNYPFATAQTVDNWNISENYTLGLGIDFTPFARHRTSKFLRNITFSGEASYYTMGFQDKSTNESIRHQSLELALLLKYRMKYFSIGVGGQLLRSVKWNKEDDSLDRRFDMDMNGFLLDLGLHTRNRRLGLGLRGYYYPKITLFDVNDINQYVGQAYIIYRLF